MLLLMIVKIKEKERIFIISFKTMTEGAIIILLTTKINCFMIKTSSYPAIFANRISSSNGLIGKPVRVWDNPVTVIVSKLHDVTEA